MTYHPAFRRQYITNFIVYQYVFFVFHHKKSPDEQKKGLHLLTASLQEIFLLFLVCWQHCQQSRRKNAAKSQHSHTIRKRRRIPCERQAIVNHQEIQRQRRQQHNPVSPLCWGVHPAPAQPHIDSQQNNGRKQRTDISFQKRGCSAEILRHCSDTIDMAQRHTEDYRHRQ